MCYIYGFDLKNSLQGQFIIESLKQVPVPIVIQAIYLNGQIINFAFGIVP